MGCAVLARAPPPDCEAGLWRPHPALPASVCRQVEQTWYCLGQSSRHVSVCCGAGRNAGNAFGLVVRAAEDLGSNVLPQPSLEHEDSDQYLNSVAFEACTQ